MKKDLIDFWSGVGVGVAALLTIETVACVIALFFQ